MTCGNAYERLSFYALNGSIAHWRGAIEIHLMDSLLDTSEVEQHYALNSSTTMIMVIHIKMDLMELLT